MQDVFRTRCGPQGEQLMVGVCERPPAADGDEARVAVFREDHGCTLLLASAQRPGFSRRDCFLWTNPCSFYSTATRDSAQIPRAGQSHLSEEQWDWREEAILGGE